MRCVLTGIGQILTGRLEQPTRRGSVIAIEDGKIVAIGDASPFDGADVTIDCAGMVVAPGLVDTHVHPVLGDYTPKQRASGFLEHMVHGGVTRVVSAGEIHAPGRRPRADAALHLATTARDCYTAFRPLGLKVHAGAVLLEEDASEDDIARASHEGITMVGEVGIGSLKDPERAGQLSCCAQDRGMSVVMHCGATSDRGHRGHIHPYYSAADVAVIKPTVASHVNTFVSLTDDDIDMLCQSDAPQFLEVVQAGGVKAMLRVVERLSGDHALERLLIGTDTPTGYGLLPIGILKTLGDLCSLTSLEPAAAWAIASGNASGAFGFPRNEIAEDAAADIVVFDAALGSPASSGLDALSRGEIPGVALVLIDGEVVVRGSQHTFRSRREPVITTGAASGPSTT